MRRLVVVAAVVASALAAVGGAGSAPASSPNLAAYRGLGTWIDLYDKHGLAHPEADVASMKARGVRTLFLETGNYRQSVDLVHPQLMGRFVDAAHEDGLRIVAWYLPSFGSSGRDYRRSLAAIRFRSPAGGRFDSFALDIEASVVKSVAVRNRRLLALSGRLRSAVGSSYPLGAIIPSPRGMQLLPHYWPGFPYAQLADTYDVFLPMGYFSYRPTDLGGPYGYTVRNVSLIRRGTGDPAVPIHAIGGLSESTKAAQVGAFVRATRDCGLLGASMYDFSTTKTAGWKQLKRVRVAPRPAASRCS